MIYKGMLKTTMLVAFALIVIGLLAWIGIGSSEFVPVVTGKEYNAETKTITVKFLGTNISELQLLGNTENCNCGCEALLRVKSYVNLNLSIPASRIGYSISFLNDKNITNYYYRVLRQENVTVNVTDFTSNVTVATANDTIVTYGSKLINYTRTFWDDFDFFNYFYEAKKDNFIRLTAEKNCTDKKVHNIDWQFQIAGFNLSEWAWWNSSYSNKHTINFTYSYSSGLVTTESMRGFPVPINGSAGFTCQGSARQYAWTIAQNQTIDQELYCDSATAYEAANTSGNERLCLEVEAGGGWNYTPTACFRESRGLVARLDMRNRSDGLRDSSDVGNSAYFPDAAQKPREVGGIINGSLQFNASGCARDNLTGSASRTIHATAANNWSVEFWYMNEASLNDVYIIAGTDAATTGNGFACLQQVNDTLFCSTGGSSATQKLRTLPSTNGQWNHIVITWAGNLTQQGSIYRNGILEGRDAQPSPSVTVDQLNEGFGFTCAGTWRGRVDEVRVWNRVLSPQEINISYESANSSVAARLSNNISQTVVVPSMGTVSIISTPIYINNSRLNASSVYNQNSSLIGTVRINWTRDGTSIGTVVVSNVPNGTNVSVLAPTNFTFSHFTNITVEATGDDNTTNTSVTRSTTIQVLDTAPNLSAISRYPLNPTAADTRNFSVAYTDLDADNATLTFQIFVNGALQNTTTRGTVGNNTNISIPSSVTVGYLDNVSVLANATSNAESSLARLANFTIASRAPVVNSIAFNESRYRNSLAIYNVSVNVTDADGSVYINNATLEVIDPLSRVYVNNLTLNRNASNNEIWWGNFTPNATEGNWTIRIWVNDTENTRNSSATYFIYDVTAPAVTITPYLNWLGRMVNESFNISVNSTESFMNVSSVEVQPGNGTTQYNYTTLTANFTVAHNTTANDRGGNYTVRVCSQDVSNNRACTTGWFGLANVSIEYTLRFELGNYTSTANAWGSVTALSNNSVSTVDYIRIMRLNFSGICYNCTVTITANMSGNFTGNYVLSNVTDQNNRTVNHTFTTRDNISFVYATNLSTNQNLSELVYVRAMVPNALLYATTHDANGVLWYAITVRNVSGTVHSNNSFARTATPTTHAFDSAASHPRYNFCLGGIDTSVVPPTCSTLSVAVDVTDTNNGANGDIDLLFDGATNARNVRRFRMQMSDVLFRETIEGGSTTQAGGGQAGGGGGGGGGPAPPAAPIAPVPCPPGFELKNDTALGKEVCREVKPLLPQLTESKVAFGTVALIGVGILYVLTAESRRKVSREKRKKDELFGL